LTDKGKGEFFRDVVDAVERAGHTLCVLRGYRNYPEHLGPDIDAIFDEPDQLFQILSQQKVATVVQVFEHETTFYYLFRWDDGRPIFINLDLSTDYSLRGRVFFKGEEFLQSCRQFKFFKIPSAELEFASYLVRKVAQGALDDDQAQRLSDLYQENPQGSTRQLARFFPETELALIADAAQSGEWEPVRERLGHLRRVMMVRVNREQPLGALRYWIGVLSRRVGTVVRPPGLMIAFLGTDGSGKSTIMTRIELDLSPLFWRKGRYHKRPLSSPFRWTRRYGLRPPGATRRREAGKRTDGAASGFDPHALPPRGLVYSLAKLGFWWADFLLLGYAAEILPQLTRPSLLIFDRYYHDLLVDPRRYHYSGPMWLARLVGRFVPQPHLIILLDAPPEVLHARKQELPLEEVIRQREAYLELVRDLPNGHVVDTSKPLDETAVEVERIIINYIAERTARRRGSGRDQANVVI